MKNAQKLCLFVCVVLLSGCASSYKKPLTEDFKQSLVDVNLGTLIRQNGIDARTESSISGTMALIQFGFIGGMVGSLIDSRIERQNLKSKAIQLAPMQAALSSFDFNRQHFEAAVNLSKSFEWLNLQETIDIASPSKLKFTSDQYFLLYETRYQLSESFDSLEIHTDVSLSKIKIGRVKKKRVESTEIFRNTYRYLSPTIPVQTKSTEEITQLIDAIEAKFQVDIDAIKGWSFGDRSAKTLLLKRERRKALAHAVKPYTSDEEKLAMAKYWARTEGKLLKGYLQSGLVEINKMIQLDLPDTKSVFSNKKDKTLPLYHKNFQKLSEENGRLILRYIRVGDGRMCSVGVKIDPKRCIEES